MKNIIVVENEPLYLRYLTEEIPWETYGLRLVGSYRSSKDALAALNTQQNIHGVFTDIKMPVLNGIELIRQAFLSNPRRYYVALSGFDDFSLVKSAFLSGANDYILKMHLATPEFDKTIQKLHAFFESSPSDSPRPDAGVPPGSQSSHRIIAEALNFVNQNYSQDISLERLAQELNISKGYLSSLFPKEVGMTLGEYLTNLRLEQAKQYLITTTLFVSEISRMVGYNNNEHFSRTFKRHVGFSPTEFRHQYSSLP